MSERVVVRQNNKFEIEFQARDPHDPETDEIQPVVGIHELTPYTMLLSSLGACTTIVLHTYAQNHDVNLQEVELQLQYYREFQDEQENAEQIGRYEERIEENLILRGDLNDLDRQKLFQVSRHCSIHQMMEAGIEINSQLLEPGGEG